MKISDVCKATGLTKKAIYYYINAQLLNPERDKHNSYHHFSEEDLHRLRIIAVMRNFGMSCEQMKLAFRYPNMVNFFMHQHMENLLQQLASNLENVRSISSLLLSMPPQYNIDSLDEFLDRQYQLTDQERSALDFLCPSQDARMVSIFIWCTFLDVEESEYRHFLWRKMTELTQKELSGSLRYVAKVIYSTDPKYIRSNSLNRYQDSMLVIKMNNASKENVKQRLINDLITLSNDETLQIYWNLNYEKVMFPIFNLKNGPLNELMIQYNENYKLYLDHLNICVNEVAWELLHGSLNDLYQSLKQVLHDQFDIENYPGIIGYNSFEKALYTQLPIPVMKKILASE